jgi:hypothetical protein
MVRWHILGLFLRDRIHGLWWWFLLCVLSMSAASFDFRRYLSLSRTGCVCSGARLEPKWNAPSMLPTQSANRLWTKKLQ